MLQNVKRGGGGGKCVFFYINHLFQLEFNILS